MKVAAKSSIHSVKISFFITVRRPDPPAELYESHLAHLLASSLSCSRSALPLALKPKVESHKTRLARSP